MSLKLLREFIREQAARGDLLGAKGGMHTLNTEPFTFDDFEGYDVDITANVNDGYMLTVKYEGEKVSPSSVYGNYEEANHQARMIIDKHRVKAVEPRVKAKEI